MSLPLGTNDRLTSKRWGRDVEREVLPATLAQVLVSKRKGTSPFTMRDELKVGRGDRLRIPYLHLSNQSPIRGVPIDGQEHRPDYSDYDLIVNKDSQAERREVDMNDQRAEFADQFRDDMKYLLSSRWTETIEISLLNALGGNSTGQSHDGTAGFDANNTITEPSANYHLFSGAATSEATLAAGDVLSSEDIREAATRAEVLRTQFKRPVIKRASMPGTNTPMWGMVISPRQRDHLYAEAATAGSFFDLQRAYVEGGTKNDNSSILSSRYQNTTYQKIGTYAGVCIYVDPYTPFGQSTPGTLDSDIDRSIFFGAGAGAIGFGRTSPDLGKFSWREEEFRYMEEYGIAAVSIWGAVKAQIDGEDLGTIVISSHAEDV